jgi:DNA-directed RNA polymerase subunit M/transcription elongation factor TFIIS
METLDPATEWLRLSERYRQMSDDELLALSRQSYEMTEVAQQVLAQEISQRKLKLQPDEPIEEPPAPPGLDTPKPEPPPDTTDAPDNAYAADPTYAKDRELVEICIVWSLPDALQVQTLLDTAGIPFFMGLEKATVVDAVTSNFADGVSVQIMRVGLPWARQALQHYTPANEPDKGKDEELNDLAIRCPKCHSTEVVFERLLSEPASATDNSSSKYEWTCDSCGHQWEDEGVVKEE